jgi:trehalose 6-phosphate phosphatase
MNQIFKPLQNPPQNLLTHASLFLDFDGTLVDFAPRPEAVVVDLQLAGLVKRLTQRLDGRLAIISGRSAEQVYRLFGDVPFAVAGSHGLELRWPDGRTLDVPRPEYLADVEAEMDRLAAGHPGVLVERKPFGAALHFRMAPAAADACRELALSLEQRTGLHLQAGNMVFELRAPWADKGSALTFLMAGSDMSGTRPVFIGDDITDEAAFAAALRLGGAGILVGPPRETAAVYGLANVRETLDWLEAALGTPQ